MNPQQKMLLNQIMKFQFATLDSALFLDTHPNDPVALAYHNKSATMLKQLKAEYQRFFGGLTMYCPDTNCWRYNKGPWPWEINY